MLAWNIVLLIVSFGVFILIASKFTQFNSIYQENLRVQQSIESLVERNSQLVNVILDELEEKVDEAHNVVGEIDLRLNSANAFHTSETNRQVPFSPQPQEKNRPKPQPRSKSHPMPQPVPSFTPLAESYTEEIIDLNDDNISIGAKVVYMKKMGMSVQEIAQRLNISQGEIALKLNLQAKHEAPRSRSKGHF